MQAAFLCLFETPSCLACRATGRMAIHAMEARGFHSKLQSMKVGILLGDGINGERIEEGIEKNI